MAEALDAPNKAGEQNVHDNEVEYNHNEERGSCEVANCPDYYYCVPVGLKSHTCEYNAQLAKQNRKFLNKKLKSKIKSFK